MSNINARHGVICTMPHNPFGYFAWPSVTVMEDGTLVAAASGFRHTHVCPWGRTVIFKSKDNGETWTAPITVNNTPMDDRDAGIIQLPGNRLAVTWFTSDTRIFYDGLKTYYAPDKQKALDGIMKLWSDDMVKKYSGSWIRVSPDGEYWGDMMRAPVNTPHGFIVLKDGSWLYLGKDWTIEETRTMPKHDAPIMAARSTDEGKSWEKLGIVPLPEGISNDKVHEPHVVELPDGTLLGAIRSHSPFNIIFSKSQDGGRTWSVAHDENIPGSPPHLLLHSSGALVCVYGYRLQPFGQRAAISYDCGKTWTKNIILRDDGPSADLGYPCTCELPNGELLTVYYQQINPNENCSLLYTRWKLPE